MKKVVRRGFTLIELLVVIAIIAILAAILFPVFARARDRARQAACLSNMQQLSRAFLQYFSDWDDNFPPYLGVAAWGDKDQPGVPGTGWSERIYPYVRSLEVYRCPANNVSNFAYSMNYMSSVRRYDSAVGKWTAGHTTAVKSPTKFIHLMECPGAGRQGVTISANGQRWPNGDSDLTNDDQLDKAVYPRSTGATNGKLDTYPHADAEPINQIRDDILLNRASQRIGHLHFPGWHSGGNNLMFLDGHVRYFKTWDDNAMTFYWDEP